MNVVGEPTLSVRTLASGSSGNLALVRSGDDIVALDLGIASQRGLMEALARSDVVPAALTAAIVSHEHSDHLSYSGLRICAAAGVPVLAGSSTIRAAGRTWQARLGKPMPSEVVSELEADTTYLVGSLEVTPFRVSHDVPTFGFTVVARGAAGLRKLSIATDLGCVTPGLAARFADSDALLVEANYDEDLLRKSPRHPEDKARVASDVGHLSNVQSGRFLAEIAANSKRLPRAVVLVHLSDDHNRPELALRDAGDLSGIRKRVPEFLAAPRLTSGPWIDL